MRVTEIRIAGFGGQGVILLGQVIGKAACIYEEGYSVLTQVFGPEARGGAASAQVVLSDRPVLYPYVTQPDISIILSQEAFARFSGEIKPNGLMLVEQELVEVSAVQPGVKVIAAPATRLAEEIGKRMVMNIVMAGVFAAIAGVVSPDAMRQAVQNSVPKAYREMNAKAFESGFEYGKTAAPVLQTV